MTAAKAELAEHRTTPPNLAVLRTVVRISEKQPTASWRYLLSSVSCGTLPLALALRALLSRRNELFTSYNKFIISNSCELDFKHMQKPDEFIRAFFGSELSNRVVLVLTTQLSPEEAENGGYLRTTGVFGGGWRLSNEGMLEFLGEGKIAQLGGCFLVRKPTLGIGYCPVEVCLQPESPAFMRVFCLSKKLTPNLKLYLHHAT